MTTIVGNRQWLEVLNRWCAAEGRPCETHSPPFDLSPHSWKTLQAHLVRTDWFDTANDRVWPNGLGQDFLVRISELWRSMNREARQDKAVVEMLEAVPIGPAADIGCGPGHSVLRLARLGFAPVYAYDLSPVALEITRALLDREGKDGYLYARDATQLAEVASSSLALIYSRGALHYFNQRQIARSIYRTLRPGGHLIAELVGLRYYLRKKHLRNLLRPNGLWKPLSYARTVFRTLIFELFTFQPRLAAGAPEIGFTKRSIRRFGRFARLEVVSISPSPSSFGGYLAVLQKATD